MEIHPYKIVSRYPDGAVSEFWPGHGDVEAQKAGAACTGFCDDLMRFGLAHDLMHHWVAERLLRRSVSRVVWASAHNKLIDFERQDGLMHWPDRMRDEEHFVNTTLRMLSDGDLRDPIGNMDLLTDDLLGYLAGARVLLSRYNLLPDTQHLAK